MTLLPKDRRGLGEIMSWTICVVMLGVIVLGYLARNRDVPEPFVIVLAGALTVAIARGTDKAGQRAGAVELQNAESAELRAARERLDEATRRLELMTDRMFDRAVDLSLPAPPRAGDKS